jgi:hypothetical protein
MRKLLVACVVVVVGWVAFGLSGGAQEGPKFTVKQVMKACHAKGGLKDKVIAGTATDEEKKQLVECYTALVANKPPRATKRALRRRPALAVGREGRGRRERGRCRQV